MKEYIKFQVKMKKHDLSFLHNTSKTQKDLIQGGKFWIECVMCS